MRLLHRETGPLRLRFGRIGLDRTEVGLILRIGVPAGLQGMVFSFSNIFVQTAINAYGAAAIAGASVSQMFDAYCYFLLSAFCGAAMTFVGQNYGAGQNARCRRIFWICLACGAGSCMAANVLIAACLKPVLALFTTDAAVVRFATERTYAVLVFQWIAAFYEVPAASMRGFGHSLEPALLTIFGTCVLRLAWIFLLTPVWPGFGHLMLCYPVSWVLTSVFVSILFVRLWRSELRVAPVA